jgi:uncharacterized protein YwgA
MVESKLEDSGVEEIRPYILALFNSDNGSPVKGRIMLIKQTFLIAKKIVPSLAKIMEFFPYLYGPYSNEIAKEVNWLIKNGYVNTHKKGRDFIYELTVKGREYAEEITQHIPKDTLIQIEKMKRTTQDLGLNNVLEMVYRQFPDYAIYSRGLNAHDTV